MPRRKTTGSKVDWISDICFGLNRELDERSLAAFLQRLARPGVLAVLVPRLTDQEISAVCEQLSSLLRRHLSEEEYHRLFLSAPE